MRNGLKLMKVARGTSLGALEDAPWAWKGAWRSDMDEFFQAPEISKGVYDNVFDNQYYSLDDSPVTWHITEVSPLPI